MKKVLLCLLSVVLFVSCSEYSRVLKKGTNDQKYDLAVRLYKDRDYVRALPLFEELLTVYRGKEQSEQIYYYYAYSHYGLGQYELAAFHFKTFTENFYNSKHMEECYYMYGRCLYEDALPYFLDQTSTTKAIGEIQIFLNLYPNSRWKDTSNIQIEDLRNTLKKKAFENAILFYQIEDYLAAVVSFRNIIKDFPDMENKSEIEFLTVKATYLYAKNSVDEKKVERYNAVFDEYREFEKTNKPGSKYYEDAKFIFTKAQVELAKHKKLNKIQ